MWALVLTVAVIVIRFVWMFPAAWLPRKLVPGLAKRDPMPSFGELVVLGWTGMRGIVSLAAALALPATLANGEPFVERPLIIFLAYAVTLLTLIVPTVTLPLLLGILESAITTCDWRGSEGADCDVRGGDAIIWSGCADKASIATRCSTDVAKRYEGQLNRLRPNLDTNASSLLDPTDQQTPQAATGGARVGARHAASDAVADELYDEYFHQLSDELDLEALRVRRNMRPL